MRVQTYLTQHGSEFVVQQMSSSTRTAEDAARSIGCQVAQIAKSLVFKDVNNGKPILVVASGVNRVSIEKVEQATGLVLGKANAAYVKEQTGFTIGGVPPVAHHSKILTLLDTDLQRFSVLWAAAGTPNSVFKLQSDELQRLTEGRWIKLASE